MSISSLIHKKRTEAHVQALSRTLIFSSDNVYNYVVTPAKGYRVHICVQLEIVEED